MADYDFLVLGAGPGGITSARTIKKRAPSAKVGVIREQKRSVVPCAMPYALNRTIIVNDFLKSDEKFFFSQGIDLVVDRVEEIDLKKHLVRTSSGKKFGFKKLVYALGANPIRPPIPGADLERVFTIKDTPDITALDELFNNAKKLVVVGAGFIGLEMAMVSRDRGLEVVVVEKLERCLGKICTDGIARKAQQELEEHGVKLALGRVVQGIEKENHQLYVHLDDSSVLEADAVIFSIGVKPNVELARSAGIKIGELGGIWVDEYMRTSHPDVYAIGDCIQFPHFLTKKPALGPLATNAVIQAKVAGINLTGGERKFAGLLNPAVTRLWKFSYGVVGLTPQQAEEEGFEPVVSSCEVQSRHRPFPGSQPFYLSLVFDKKSKQLIGAEAYGNFGVPEKIDLLAYAILHKATAQDLAEMHFCAHPPQTEAPSKMPIVLCAEDALSKM